MFLTEDGKSARSIGSGVAQGCGCVGITWLAAATLAVICTRISHGAAGTGSVWWLEVRSKSGQILQFGGTQLCSRILVGQDASAAHVSDATLVSGVRRGILLLSP